MRDYRADFFDFGETVYLNCAFHGPFPRRTVERIEQAIDLKRNPSRMESRHFFDTPARVRERLAQIIGARPEDVALTNSATQGVGCVASGLLFDEGDEVVVASDNFPSNLFTWIHLRRQGVKVHVVEPRAGALRTEDVARVVSPLTKVLALDWVSYNTGAKIDLVALGELAHRHEAFFVVDGTQGVGAIELDVRALPVDALVVAAYKWLLGPYSTGFAYFSPRLLGLLEPSVINWLTVEGAEAFDSLPKAEFTLPKTAKVFDVPATADFLNVYALDASLEYIQEVGVPAVHKHCRRLLEKLVGALKQRGYSLSAAAEAGRESTILCFAARSPEETKGVARRLKEKHVAVSLRHEMIRVSPYLYNREEDIDRLLEALE